MQKENNKKLPGNPRKNRIWYKRPSLPQCIKVEHCCLFVCFLKFLWGRLAYEYDQMYFTILEEIK